MFSSFGEIFMLTWVQQIVITWPSMSCCAGYYFSYVIFLFLIFSSTLPLCV